MRVVLALMCCAALVWAAEQGAGPGAGTVGAGDLAAGDGEALDRGAPPVPGHDPPVAPAAACVLRFDWDTYRTVIVVGVGVGMVKPAWVTTFEKGLFIVGYRATAFRDVRGRLHIDARRARDVGPNAENWVPDSFAFGHKLLWTLDDQGNGHSSDMGTVVQAAAEPAVWLAELQRVQALIEGGL